MIYFAYVHSIVSYGIIFWGNSTHSNLIFKIKKRIVRIIMKTSNKDSCLPLFRQLNILPLYSQYILSVLIFVVKNLDIFKFNSAIHSINTRQGSDLHLPTNNLAKVQKAVYTTQGLEFSIIYHKTLRTCQTMLINSNRP
jgi:hypothetical protein